MKHSAEKGETLIETLISSIILTTALSSLLLTSQLLYLIYKQSQELIQATQLATSIAESIRTTNDIRQFEQLWQQKVSNFLTNGHLNIMKKNDYWLINIAWARSNDLPLTSQFLCSPDNVQQHCLTVAASDH